jgi:hypothetical protein
MEDVYKIIVRSLLKWRLSDIDFLEKTFERFPIADIDDMKESLISFLAFYDYNEFDNKELYDLIIIKIWNKALEQVITFHKLGDEWYEDVNENIKYNVGRLGYRSTFYIGDKKITKSADIYPAIQKLNK